MKFVHCLVTVALLVAAGCLPDSFLNKEDAEKVAPAVNRQAGKPRNYIAPDQVDERNFREKEKVLRQELEMDEQDAPKATAPAPAKR